MIYEYILKAALKTCFDVSLKPSVRCWACKRSFVTSVVGKCILGSTCGTFSIKNFLPPMPTLYSNKILRRVTLSMWKGIVFQKWNSTWCGFQTVVELCWNDVSGGWWASGIVGVARRIVGREEKCSATNQATTQPLETTMGRKRLLPGSSLKEPFLTPPYLPDQKILTLRPNFSSPPTKNVWPYWQTKQPTDRSRCWRCNPI